MGEEGTSGAGRIMADIALIMWEGEGLRSSTDVESYSSCRSRESETAELLFLTVELAGRAASLSTRRKRNNGLVVWKQEEHDRSINTAKREA